MSEFYKVEEIRKILEENKDIALAIKMSEEIEDIYFKSKTLADISLAVYNRGEKK